MKNRRGTVKKLTAFFMVIVTAVILLSSPLEQSGIINTAAATDSKVKTYEERIAQLQKDQKAYEQQIKDAKANAASYLQQKEYLDKQIAALTEQIELSNALIIEYNNAIAAKEEAITAKEGELDVKFDHFKDRLRVSYEEGTMGYLTMLFSSKSIGAFLTSLERMTNMLTYDKRTMGQINSEKAELSSEKASLEEIRASQQALYDDLKKNEAELEKKAEEAENYYNEAKNSEEVLNKKLNEAKKAEEKAAKELDAYLVELANKNNGVYTGGAFSWPLPQNQVKITSKHGWRTYWIWGRQVTDYHRGIDISCPTGTPVYAGADGIVEIAGWNDSYGYYVVISHGSGYTTLYAHNSLLKVKKGQRVKRGEVISSSGSTGNSSGPHLHLEISINGKLQDPLANGILSHPKLTYLC